MSKNDSMTEDDDSFLNLYSTESVTSKYNNLVEKLKSSRKEGEIAAGAEKSEATLSKRVEVIADVSDSETESGIRVKKSQDESDVIVLDDSGDSRCDSGSGSGLRRSSRLRNLKEKNSDSNRESTADSGTEIEVVTPTSTATKRRRQKRAKNSESQTEETSQAPRQKPDSDSIRVDDDVNYEVSIKIIWKSASVRTFQLRRFQKFSKIFDQFMQEENVSCDKIYLTVKERKISPSDTPDSLNLQVFDFIEGGVLTCSNDAPIEKDKKDDSFSNSEDSVVVKLQNDNKQVFKFTLNKSDTFKSMMIRYAEQIEIPLSKIKFYFDGEMIDHSETPNSLGLDDNEVIDVKII